MAWAPDRLSRNAGDLGTLVDLMDQKLLIEIRTYGQRFINSPNEKFLLMILCSQAKLENDNKSINVRRGLRARVEMGLWPTTAPTGYLNQKMMDKKCQVSVDPQRAPIIKKMFEKMAYEKCSGRKIYHWLRFELNFRTQYNHHLSLSNIYLILQNHFYYGTFEYPKGSGNWYAGKHEPLITKELFEQTQEQLKRSEINRETREFAFTKLLVCGLCGSGITAQEKYKKLKDGTMARYVYYACTRSRDLHCKNEYIREEELINKLLDMIDKIDMNELGLKVRLEDEVARYSKFQNMMGMINSTKVKTKTLNTRTFVKYVLKEGSIVEKRELLANMKSRLVITNKELTLQE
jgi:site-specific DNA recombinase